MKLANPENFNIELGTSVLKHLTAHPEQHNQGLVMSECRTVGCIAGWTNLIDDPEAYTGWSYGTMVDAEHRLGLTREEGEHLFCMGATKARSELRSFIHQAVRYRRRVQREEEKRQRAIDRAARKQRWTTWTMPKLPTFKKAKRIEKVSR